MEEGFTPLALVISVTLAVLPVAFLLVYFISLHPRRKPPAKSVLRVFFLGVLAIVPTFLFEWFFQEFGSPFISDNLHYNLFKAFLVAGFSEEFMKFTVVIVSVYEHKDFAFRVDGVIYTIAASLGFACFENVMYVLTATPDRALSVAIIRGLTAVPAHAFFSGIMGYFIGLGKFRPRVAFPSFVGGLLIAITLHGTYNFLIFHYAPYPIFDGGFMLFALAPLLFASYRLLTALMDKHFAKDVQTMRRRKNTPLVGKRG